MGNILTVNLNLPIERLFSLCCTQPGAPRRSTINDLQNNWARLKATRDDISRQIEESPDMRPLEIVNRWLRRVAALEAQVDKLVTDSAQESANKCLCSYCPINCKKSYSLWRKIAPMDQEVLNLQSQVPDIVVERPRIAPTLHIPTDPTTGMESMLHEVWSHVENQQEPIGLIGLYGMGGVGKTTLLKAVNNKLRSSTLNFDLQLWIVVSKTPNLIDIQNKIGGKVGFIGSDWKGKSEEAKAMDIYAALQKKKYILLLDDIWKRLDLTKIGIPLPNSDNKSKIIFTTRSKQVCGEMRATRIKVQCLKEEVAWILFKQNVGEDALNAHHDIPGLAKDVMRECCGLPLALIVIGRAMTCAETIQEWEHAIQVLKRYAADFSNITDEVFTPLKFSYDNLNEDIRSCFLYCSLYPEDEEILKSDLIDKWICEGFMGRSDNDLRKDQNKGHHYISTLVHASLLEECSPEKVKMHDVIRDMALWIGGDGFYVQAQAGLTQIPNDVKWKHVEKLSLMHNYIGDLTVPTESLDLKTILFLRGRLMSINNDFFNLVPNLQVLDLSLNPMLTSLPEQFCELVFLQYLNLEGTGIKELPNELRKLVKLKYLNVQETRVETIPKGVLLSMKELSVFRCGESTCYDSDFLGENLVKELEGLKFLQDVSIPASSEVHISNLISSMKLLNCITTLTLIGIPGLDILFLKKMKHVQNLHIVSGTISKIEDWVMGGFNTIRSLQIRRCHRLMNLSWLVFCPNIERIEVTDCRHMETLLGDEVEYILNDGVFAKLRSLRLVRLPCLKSICVNSLPFPCLNSLYVDGSCQKLKELPFNSSSCDQGRGITIEGTNKWWRELQWEDEATRAIFSSSFQSYTRYRQAEIVAI